MDWLTLRAEFPVTRHWAFFDHAAVAPLPRRTADALRASADDMEANGVSCLAGWVRRTDTARQRIARLIGSDPLDVALLKNTSEGIGVVAEGFPWRNGDNVVLAAEEYPSNQYPWINLASRGVAVRSVPSRGNRVAIDDLCDAIDARTRVLAVSFVEFASGFRNDLDALAEICRLRGVALLVDAIQGLGALPLDMSQTRIDFLACGGHKWLCGPQGTAFLYVRREWLDRLRPIGVGASSVVGEFDYGTIDYTLKPHAGRYESGTLNFGGLAALGESVGLWLEVGAANVAERVKLLTDHLCDRAKSAGVPVFSSRDGNDWSGIVSLEVADAEATAKRCRAAGIVVRERGGRLRVAPHAYNTTDEIDRLVEVLACP
ncbi:MAG: aminotransferase class V-fold PLP-dependent enzyme [Gemmataceae bacterium]